MLHADNSDKEHVPIIYIKQDNGNINKINL